MKTSFLGLAALLLLSLPLAAAKPAWELDPNHTRVGFQVKHMQVAKVNGEFKAWKASLDIDDKDLTRSKVSIDIDAASVDTGIEKRDEHLRAPDFFDVTRTPKVSFRSTKVLKNADGSYTLEGDLEIRGLKLPVSLRAEASEVIKTDWGTLKRGFSLEGKVSRTAYKVGPESTLMIGDEVKLLIDGEMDKPDPDKKAKK